MATSPKTFLPLILGGALLSLAIAPAVSAEQASTSDRASVEVSLSGLDLSQEADARVAIGRIETAARKVCRSVAARSVLAPRIVHECQRETVARTLKNFEGDRPMLAALAAGENADNKQ